MKCQILFPGKNKKNISKYRPFKILPRVLSVKAVVPVLFVLCGALWLLAAGLLSCFVLSVVLFIVFVVYCMVL